MLGKAEGLYDQCDQCMSNEHPLKLTTWTWVLCKLRIYISSSPGKSEFISTEHMQTSSQRWSTSLGYVRQVKIYKTRARSESPNHLCCRNSHVTYRTVSNLAVLARTLAVIMCATDYRVVTIWLAQSCPPRPLLYFTFLSRSPLPSRPSLFIALPPDYLLQTDKAINPIVIFNSDFRTFGKALLFVVER